MVVTKAGSSSGKPVKPQGVGQPAGAQPMPTTKGKVAARIVKSKAAKK
jgi:hypothetical protein